VIHLKSRRLASAVALTWDARGGQTLRWRVLRATERPADGPFDDTVVGSGQSLISDQTRPGTHDEDCSPGGVYHYAIFAEDERGQWHRVAAVKVSVKGADRAGEADFESHPGGTSWLDAGWAARAGSGDTPRQ
jgi:hypothetical protein